ncbi:alkyl/aryl-sulfatase [Photobacterium gaetbulicola]|uniref:Alkyl sulfatase n=1 Tax=Photobacterium gaetbulicola Gung47 TaxID=658445 RepID=A0A0C5WU63_9GAMM|nr:alkyl sulfatase dimerization domain-containing protein [Photobacterium gaetbulicola]AJR06600.1 alkyl sulfatase [Photobacterium gaetbulicola Gung47]PSU13927.1 alkyl/aryl-sulfatase [Photobacterium gaetbulicola]
MKRTLLSIAVAATSCVAVADYDSLDYTGKPATKHTIVANNALDKTLPWHDTAAFERSERGLIAAFGDHSAAELRNSRGYLEVDDVRRDRPDTVNPSLWRQGAMNYASGGLYEVTDGVYQIRGADLSNMTIYRSDNGYIIHDPLITREAATAAWDFAKKHLPPINGNHTITGVIYSHTHPDHYGGVRGLFEDGQLPEGVEIYAPKDFMEELLSEGLLAGNAMGRRAQYQYGNTLPDSAYGVVDNALGMGTTKGEITLIPPTVIIEDREETVVIDGLEMLFINMPGAEAPTEMINYVPAYNALNTAELTYDGQHNIYTFRGAQTRDSLAWTKYLSEIKHRFADNIDNIHAAHSAPVWNNPETEVNEIADYLTMQRDNYGFIHNQTLRLANQGVKINDIGRAVEAIVPESQQQNWASRGYHGSYSHNARGVINLYLGYHDMNPTNINPLTNVDRSCLYVQTAGADTMYKQAQHHFNQGAYQEASTLLNDIVNCEPTNIEARELLADSWEQQGYQSETMAWRNSYLQGASELRTNHIPEALKAVSPDIMSQMTTAGFLDFMAVSIDASKVPADMAFNFNIVHPEVSEVYYVEFSNANLAPLKVETAVSEADLTLSIARNDLIAVITGQASLEQLIDSQKAKVDGDTSILSQLKSVSVEFKQDFEIVPIMN